jgi:hypothetical protein
MTHIHQFSYYLELELHRGYNELEIHKDTFENGIYLALQYILKQFKNLVKQLQRNGNTLQRFKTAVYISVTKYFKIILKNSCTLQITNSAYLILGNNLRMSLLQKNVQHKPITAQMEHKKQL